MARAVKKEVKPLSPKTILIFRIGMVLVVLALAVVTAILIIRSMDKTEEQVNPFTEEEKLHSINLSTLKLILGEQEEWEQITDEEVQALVMNESENVYIYFYYSSEINDEVKKHILSKAFLEAVEDKPLFLVDLNHESFAEFNITTLKDNQGNALEIDTIALNYAKNKQLVMQYSKNNTESHVFAYKATAVIDLLDSIDPVTQEIE